MEAETLARRNLARVRKLVPNRKVLLRKGFLKRIGNRGTRCLNMKNIYTYKNKATTMEKGTL